ncbi:immunity 53 family protein [Pedobacter nutrimenti]|uniref:immunity 53 family protein n=1 Tax=Pedobacter nutrimenti TaxID=1241337 RepID=UPI00292F9E22|nr:immunity 53 family protein [Pedobacter nutrimenti]
MEIIEWLSNWYKSNCDGDWEHQYGVKIDTLDNPGWSFEADLIDTAHEGKKIFIESLNDDNDWYKVSSDGEKFTGAGDSGKLYFLINLFKKFIEED